MRIVPSAEFYYHLIAAFQDHRAPDLAAFLAVDVPEVVTEFLIDWNTTLIVNRTNPYRRTIISLRHGVACTVEALLRPDGVVELERISFDWDFGVADPDIND